jgi:hypothetical protein
MIDRAKRDGLEVTVTAPARSVQFTGNTPIVDAVLTVAEELRGLRLELVELREALDYGLNADGESLSADLRRIAGHLEGEHGGSLLEDLVVALREGS